MMLCGAAARARARQRRAAVDLGPRALGAGRDRGHRRCCWSPTSSGRERFLLPAHEAAVDVVAGARRASRSAAFAAVARALVAGRRCSASAACATVLRAGWRIPAGGRSAGYTAFLFGQCEGRDLWQSPLLCWHLLAQALMAGAGALAIAVLFVDRRRAARRVARRSAACLMAGQRHACIARVDVTRRHSTRQRRSGRAHDRPRPLRDARSGGRSVAVAVVVCAAGPLVRTGRSRLRSP